LREGSTVASEPSNNEMQRTAPGEMERRR